MIGNEEILSGYPLAIQHGNKNPGFKDDVLINTSIYREFPVAKFDWVRICNHLSIYVHLNDGMLNLSICYSIIFKCMFMLYRGHIPSLVTINKYHGDGLCRWIKTYPIP